MDRISEKSLEYFRHPGKYFHLFEPTTEKLESIATKLSVNYLYLPDEMRTPEMIMLTMNALFPYSLPEQVRPLHVYYEIGDFGGLLGFCNIIPEYKADLWTKLWDKKYWGPTLARDTKVLINRFMKEWKLKRLSLSSPDERVIKFAKMWGMKAEGTQSKFFRFDNRLYTNYLFRRIES